MNTRFGVVVVNWNTRDYLRNCLQSLKTQQHAPSFEAIVVDNSSADGSAEMTASEFPEVRLLPESQNHGYARGNNIGAAESQADWLLFLNPDVQLNPDALQKLDEFIASHSDAVAVGGLLMNPDGSAQRSVRGFPTYGSLVMEISSIARLLPNLDRYFLRRFDYSADQKVQQPMGALLAIQRDLFVSLGHFDERFPIFFNDVQLCRLLSQRGSIYYTPSVRGYHEGGAGTRQVKPKMIEESHRSLIDYLRIANPEVNRVLACASEWCIKLSCCVKTHVWLRESDQRIPKGGTGS